MPIYTEQRSLPYTAEQLFSLVADVKRYPEFLPWIASTRLVHSQENSFIADVEVGYHFITDSYRSEVILTPFECIDIRYIKGPFKHLINKWTFTPLPTKGVLLDFYIDFEFSSFFMRRLMDTVFSDVISRMITAFEKRAEDLYSHHT